MEIEAHKVLNTHMVKITVNGMCDVLANATHTPAESIQNLLFLFYIKKKKVIVTLRQVISCQVEGCVLLQSLRSLLVITYFT